MTMKPLTIGIAVIAASSLLLVARRQMVGDEPGPAAPPPRSVATPAPLRYAAPMRAGAGDQVHAELAALRADVAQLRAGKPPREQLSYGEQVALSKRRAVAKFAALDKAFASDRRDSSWSAQAESKLRDAFATADVAGGHLEELSCGGTLCRYSVRFDSVAQREDASDALTSLARWDSSGFGGPAADDPRRFVFYVSRDQESFPTLKN
jgi:hypothetical protein